ncbi:class I SAM-dependent methyltransferase [Sphingomonas sp.]|uniref:class I SAM-dependent methyltransferase n=1 Tax=Sphingomonas sp. TaxID=28214 RepID=UPI002B9B26E8|nr:class I SAM-dependent methyltransferase [Sphingomonas sp.]HTG38035.1 class I SAM-dependent methyltransferase [Sphingomonas sp.]
MRAKYISRSADHVYCLDSAGGGGRPIGAELLRRGFILTGVDSSASLIRHARSALPDGNWIVDDMRRFDPAHCFDGVIAWHSFFHLSRNDQRAMIPRFARLVRSGGPIMFTSGSKAGEAWGEWQGEPLFHASLAPEEYRELLGAAGFEAITYIDADPVATIWLATWKDEA